MKTISDKELVKTCVTGGTTIVTPSINQDIDDDNRLFGTLDENAAGLGNVEGLIVTPGPGGVLFKES